MNFFPTFVITPLTFLGGVFYSAAMLPRRCAGSRCANPVFYVVDARALRHAGECPTPLPGWATVLLACLAAVAVGGAYRLLRSGYKLRG